MYYSPMLVRWSLTFCVASILMMVVIYSTVSSLRFSPIIISHMRLFNLISLMSMMSCLILFPHPNTYVYLSIPNVSPSLVYLILHELSSQSTFVSYSFNLVIHIFISIINMGFLSTLIMGITLLFIHTVILSVGIMWITLCLISWICHNVM